MTTTAACAIPLATMWTPLRAATEGRAFDPRFGTARAALAALQHGHISSRELTEHVFTRIAANNGPINAFVTLLEETALREATASDARRAKGALLGPLDGLPMLVKDVFMTTGVRTTGGQPRAHRRSRPARAGRALAERAARRRSPGSQRRGSDARAVGDRRSRGEGAAAGAAPAPQADLARLSNRLSARRPVLPARCRDAQGDRRGARRAAPGGRAAHPSVEQAVRAGDPDPTNRGLVASHLDFLLCNEERLRNLAAWQRYFGEYDAFLLPVTFTAAFAHDHSPVLRQRVLQTSGGPRPYMDLSKWISFATLAGLPATTAPIGRTSDGLPVGLQIVGPYFEDATPIDIAGKLADVVGGFVPPPALA